MSEYRDFRTHVKVEFDLVTGTFGNADSAESDAETITKWVFDNEFSRAQNVDIHTYESVPLPRDSGSGATNAGLAGSTPAGGPRQKWLK